jgi:transitional endoplasmic reticulum ATPase
MKLANDVDLKQISEKTDGYVGADLASLCSDAVLQQINEKKHVITLKDPMNVGALASLAVTKDNFEYALKHTKASALYGTSLASFDS